MQGHQATTSHGRVEVSTTQNGVVAAGQEGSGLGSHLCEGLVGGGHEGVARLREGPGHGVAQDDHHLGRGAVVVVVVVGAQ
jgi:hypothetical protein